MYKKEVGKHEHFTTPIETLKMLKNVSNHCYVLESAQANDEMSIEKIRGLKPERIILSPGPGRPEDAGIIVEAVKELGKEIPILGVCLGHQAICQAFGTTITYAKKLLHGKQSEVELDRSCPLFQGCSQRTVVARYHSLVADKDTIPEGKQMLYNFINSAEADLTAGKEQSND